MSAAKHTAVTVLLERDLARGLFFGRLPNVATLATHYGVALKTMHRAMQPLVERKLLMPTPRGTWCNPGGKPRLHTGVIGIFCGATPQGVDRDPLLCNLKALITADGLTPLFMESPTTALAQNQEFWRANGVDGYIFAYSTFHPELVATFERHGIAYLVANQLPQERNINQIGWDHRRAFEDILCKLVGDGVRNVVFFMYSSQPAMADTCRMIVDEFVAVKKQYQIFSDQKENFYPAQRLAVDDFVDFCQGLPEFPDAILCWGRRDELVARLEQIGKIPGRDYALVMRQAAQNVFDPEQWRNTYFHGFAKQLWARFKATLADPEAPPQNTLVTYPLEIMEYIHKPSNQGK